MVDQFAADHDNYKEIMVKALADRLAEAFTEYLHEKVRKELWGYSPEENYTKDQLFRMKYQGIRPAPGYPTQPDHTETAKLWKLLNAEEVTGISLTESYAMNPAASVCGHLFANPASKYFQVGLITEDQVTDYNARKGEDVTQWLQPNIH
jgi:5-methyltetrahydrofolate--homocysteine methyltransferase